MKKHTLSRRDVLAGAGTTLAFGLTLGPFLGSAIAAAAGDTAGDTKVKIGVIGSGNVGSALGRVWANVGHPVMFASRKLEHDKQLAASVEVGR